MDVMTQAAYARHRGVSRATICKMVKSGRISVNEEGKIDPEAMDGVLDPVQSKPAAEGSFSSTLTEAKIKTETIRGKNAELEYGKKVGKLLALDDVIKSMQKCAEIMVRDIDRLPTNAEEIAHEFSVKGIPGVRGKLKKIAYELKVSIADNMKLLRDGEDDFVEDEEESPVELENVAEIVQ